jgi:hypothetical protein
MRRRSRARIRVAGAHRPWEALVLLAAAVLLLLTSCGGGASDAPAAVSPAQNSADLPIAQQAYAGTPRTPADFYSEAPPAGVTGTVATLHLKNSDVAPAANGPRHELCTDDSAQAIGWSEMRPSFNGSYADIVETSSDARRFEIIRVPRSDSTARLQHRVFRCSYLDRSMTDLASESGAAGTVNSRPIDAAGLKQLSEYLWRFTTHNNADHVVLSSAPANAGAGELAHTIEMARLTRAASSSDCDTIDVLRWRHVTNSTTGAMQRDLTTVRSLRARRDNLGNVTLCP